MRRGFPSAMGCPSHPRRLPNFSIALSPGRITLIGSFKLREASLNSELCKQALAKVGNPNVLVNLISRRVRQLTSGSGAMSRPLVDDTNLGMSDIALKEIIEGKIGWDMPEEIKLVEAPAKRRKKH